MGQTASINAVGGETSSRVENVGNKGSAASDGGSHEDIKHTDNGATHPQDKKSTNGKENEKVNSTSKTNSVENKESESSSSVEMDQMEEEKQEKPKRKIDIFSLSNRDLKSHLKEFAHMTKHDIRNIADTLNLNEGELMNEEWYQTQDNSSIKIDKKLGTIQKDPQQKSIRSQMDVALLILRLSPEIKSLRFKLVPSKLSECIFWSTVFFILETCSPDNLGASETLVVATKKKTKPKVMNDVDNTIETDVASENEKGSSQINVSSAITNDDSEKLSPEALMKQKDDEIMSLRLQLTKAKKELLQLQQQKPQQSTSPSKPHYHPGKWIMSQESKEFLSLDEELKQKLRDGKQKRLQEVMEEMKFILDSDNVKDSYGKWDCCSQSVYDSTGCKIVTR